MGRGFKLTQLQVDKQKTPGLYGDGAGLSLKVTTGGSKSWIYRYMLVGKAHWMGLGSYPDTSLAEARDKAAELRKLTRQNVDPLAERRKETSLVRATLAKVITFDKAAEQFIDAHAPGWKNAKHVDQWRNTLSSYASPVIGSLDVSHIETAHIMRILEKDGFWKSKTETASRVRGRIESVLDWATVRKYRTGENPARWKGHLEALLPARTKVKKTEHHAALPWSEIAAFITDLRKQAGIAARAVEFAILTAARSGEVRGATWNEFDLAAGVWIVPAERMKAKREHRVPLPTKALELLKKQKEEFPGEIVFPGAKVKEGKQTQLSDMSLTAVLRRMEKDEITVHGFRSTFRDWAAESTEYPSEMVEMALAHVINNKVEAAYRRGDLFEKRRRLMQDWSNFCDKKSDDKKAQEMPAE
jgi:integrase